MFAGKPIIGIVGGIGSGKSYVASIFAELDCRVIDSDRQVSAVYRDPQVQQMLREWWGDAVICPDGEVNRSLIATKIFSDPVERKRLEALIHPRVHAAREIEMTTGAADAQVVAYVWDAPLLLETSLDRECDAVVFVDAPLQDRLKRVSTTRGWDAAELLLREKSQWGLDRKREISDYVISNTADADEVRGQVRLVLSRILETTKTAS